MALPSYEPDAPVLRYDVGMRLSGPGGELNREIEICHGLIGENRLVQGERGGGGRRTRRGSFCRNGRGRGLRNGGFGTRRRRDGRDGRSGRLRLGLRGACGHETKNRDEKAAHAGHATYMFRQSWPSIRTIRAASGPGSHMTGPTRPMPRRSWPPCSPPTSPPRSWATAASTSSVAIGPVRTCGPSPSVLGP